MKAIWLSLGVILVSFFLYAADQDEDLITHGAGGHPAMQHPAVHPNAVHPNPVTPAERRAINRDVNNANWNSGGGGYVLPAPASGDPLQDPNDDMNQLYQQNQQNMQRTKQ